MLGPIQSIHPTQTSQLGLSTSLASTSGSVNDGTNSLAGSTLRLPWALTLPNLQLLAMLPVIQSSRANFSLSSACSGKNLHLATERRGSSCSISSAADFSVAERGCHARKLLWSTYARIKTAHTAWKHSSQNWLINADKLFRKQATARSGPRVMCSCNRREKHLRALCQTWIYKISCS
jgi:hypothetical protein